ncbi:unnamed protein product, partial [Prorocentrum cordatum]
DDGAPQNHMARAQMKAYDQEIPWRETVNMDGASLQCFLEATRKECSNWVKRALMVPVPEELAQDMLSSSEIRKRCTRGRRCYRDNACGLGEFAAKCRGVVVGCGDPRLDARERRSPTTLRISFSDSCQILASTKARESKNDWTACVGDLENSFFQGGRERDDEVTGNIYGFADAPLDLRRHIRRKMYQLGLASHSLDAMRFLKCDKNRLVAIALWYVDDSFAVYPKKLLNFSELEKAFARGEMDFLPEQLGWRGREFNQYENGGSLHGAERTEMRIQNEDPQIIDFKEMRATIEHLRATPEVGGSIGAVAFGDSSWAYAQQLKSQTGAMVVWINREALTGSAPASFADWRSVRTQRQVRSTLAAEACAADAAVDRGYYASTYLSEVLTGKSYVASRISDRELLAVPLFAITDCKSLYDCVRKENSSLAEKRALLDVWSIQTSLGLGSMRWVPTTNMIADPFAKISDGLREALVQWMVNPITELVV